MRVASNRTGTVLAAGLLTACTVAGHAQPGAADVAAERVEVRVPGTTVSFDMVLVGGDDGLWALTTEVTWDLYDVYLYGLDEPEGGGGDAVTRPSKPYVPPDRGFGHAGYPAIGMTRHAAESFCAWLEAKTGIPARLPTRDEWARLAGGDAGEQAWTAENAEGTTHPVGNRGANAHGLHDTLGNVAEWVMTETRRPIAMGGSYREPASECTPTAAQTQTSAWNTSDPQIPKSRWWLADCSWVGFRFVVDEDKMPGRYVEGSGDDE